MSDSGGDLAAPQYSSEFYSEESKSSGRSAAVIVPLLMEMVAPRSVLDVGCGVGAFLKAFSAAGVDRIFGVDGPWVPAGALQVPTESFLTADLGKAIPPVGSFDLVTCFEVAEHLSQDRAEGFVDDLCAHGPTVAFSAAIPHQGGTDHRNEQWPSYWAALFEKRGYRTFDVLRSSLWSEPEVDRWYAQNMILFSSAGTEFRSRDPFPLDVVHPRQFARACRVPSTRELSGEVLRRGLASLRRRAGFARGR